MKTLIIRRVTTGEFGTFGTIVFNNSPFALSLEREWRDNQTNVSCIPSGEYTCSRINSPKFGHTFEVMDVPDRTHILFHKGNLDDDSHGCILVGESFGRLSGDPAILASKSGFKELMDIMAGENSFRLIVVDDWQTPLTGE